MYLMYLMLSECKFLSCSQPGAVHLPTSWESLLRTVYPTSWVRGFSEWLARLPPYESLTKDLGVGSADAEDAPPTLLLLLAGRRHNAAYPTAWR